MTANQTHWLEYGEPVDGDRVEATLRTTYQTGPNEPAREDDVEHGTLAMSALDLLEDDPEIAAHVHDDGSACLSAMPDAAEQRLLETFEPVAWRNRAHELHHEGGVPERRAQAVALIATGHSYQEAADKLGIDSRGAVSRQVASYIDGLNEARWLVGQGPDEGDLRDDPEAMTDGGQDGPLADAQRETRAIEDALSSSISVLRPTPSQPSAVLVDRDAPTEYTNAGEPIVIIEWADDWYAISTATGTDRGWELEEAPLETEISTRDQAIELAVELFE